MEGDASVMTGFGGPDPTAKAPMPEPEVSLAD